MELQARDTRFTLFAKGFGVGVVAFARDAEVKRKGVDSLEHLADVGTAWSAGCRVCACRWTGAATEHGGDAGGDGFDGLLRADEVDMAVETAGRDDAVVAGDHVGAGADDQGGRDAFHYLARGQLVPYGVGGGIRRSLFKKKIRLRDDSE